MRWRIAAPLLAAVLLAGCAGMVETSAPAPTPTVPASPDPVPTPSVEVLGDILYTSTNELDIHVPAEGEQLPVVIILHGLDGEKGLYSDGATAIAKAGAVVYNVNWRSIPWEDGEMALMEDSACAVRFARSTAAEHKGDPEQVILFGHSIGGWSGAVVALNGDSFAGDCLAEGVSAVPNAFVSLGGAYDAGESGPDGGASYLKEEDPQLWEEIYPFALLGNNRDVQFELVVGEYDLGFVQVADRFHQALKAADYQANLTILDGEDHNVRFPSPAFDQLISIIIHAADP